MKKKISILIILLMLLVSFYGSNLTAKTYACGCGCVVGCDNRCGSTCSDCPDFFEALVLADKCCNEARAATGDTGPCGAGGPSI